MCHRRCSFFSRRSLATYRRSTQALCGRSTSNSSESLMTYPDLKARYRKKSISTPEALALALGVAPEELAWVLENVESLHKPGARETKANGSVRVTHDAQPRLKRIHQKIKMRLFGHVAYPAYLQGSLRSEKNCVRGVASSAAIHAGCLTLLNEDLANFFPSIDRRAVHRIWLSVFNFPPDVATILTTLTTWKGRVPQGWIPSGYLANLALHAHEPDLVAWCRERGYKYSRYVDDISVSSARKHSKHEKQEMVEAVMSHGPSGGISREPFEGRAGWSGEEKIGPQAERRPGSTINAQEEARSHSRCRLQV